ncbi:hypothetical protein [Thermococcus paralvinellae]|uniref:Uncharacterized protein n=1 Tax=Thermococcus paralvinellae TaxID=582419 RepID=W0I5I4_9EURY|nr:hypothetical protein [Thermococcus paralvinellae]AHF79972.1 Hypothetical protein TES1_0582 [Thermococcus paralvinellae]
MELSPGVLVLLFLEDFARETDSIRRGVKYFEWQRRYDAYDVAYSIVGATLAELVKDGYIQLELKKGLLGKKVLLTRMKSIPKKYGVIVEGMNSMEAYKKVPLRSALFLSFPVSRFPAAFLGTYILKKELKGQDALELKENPEIVRKKEELKSVFESFKMQNEELWKGIIKEVDKACDLVRGKEGITLYTPLDMLRERNESKN